MGPRPARGRAVQGPGAAALPPEGEFDLLGGTRIHEEVTEAGVQAVERCVRSCLTQVKSPGKFNLVVTGSYGSSMRAPNHPFASRMLCASSGGSRSRGKPRRPRSERTAAMNHVSYSR